jgi:phosphatidyl-myo-inositol dimannoside synthase
MGPIFLTSKIFGYGGIERFGRQIIRSLSEKAGDESQHVHVFSLVDSLDKNSEITFNKNVHLKCFGENRFLFSLRSALFVLFNPSVTYVFHLHIAPIIYLVKFFRPKLRYGVHLHGIEAWITLSGLRKRAVQKADFITASSQFTADKAVEMNQLNQEKISVLYPALDEEWLKSISKKSQGFDPETSTKKHIILTVARLTESDKQKGIDHVIEALPELLKEFRDLQYVIVGSGDDLPRLRQLACDLEIFESVQFRGSISDEELISLYQTCNLFIMPSNTEGLGIVYLEAMAFAKPVISGKYGGSSEVVIPGETGYLVPYDDIPAIQNSIRAVLSNPEKASRMGKRGRLLVEEKFNLDKMASGIISLLWTAD